MNDCCQFLFFSVFLLLPFMYYLTAMRSFEKQSIKKSKILENRNKFKGKRVFKLIQYILHILIPSLIIIRHKLSFFITISLLLLALCISYFKYLCSFTRYTKIYLGLILFTLLIHHLCFSFIYVMSFQEE